MSNGLNKVEAGVLRIAYLQDGPENGWPVLLSHGFPYDVHAYDEVTPMLVGQGARVIRPYLRGFGPTTFLTQDAMRSGQQTALGDDILHLLDALQIEKAILAGFDWGGLASCVAAALWPDRVSGLVSLASYDIIDIARQQRALEPNLEQVLWYQHLFQTERGRECLQRFRREVCHKLWREWSPNWHFDETTFEQTAVSFDNPDFVSVVIHAYRFHFGLTKGDPSFDSLEQILATKPHIKVPAVTLDGINDPLKPGGTADQAEMFLAKHEHHEIVAGHNLPQEAPGAFFEAVLTVHLME